MKHFMLSFALCTSLLAMNFQDNQKPGGISSSLKKVKFDPENKKHRVKFLKILFAEQKEEEGQDPKPKKSQEWINRILARTQFQISDLKHPHFRYIIKKGKLKPNYPLTLVQMADGNYEAKLG